MLDEEEGQARVRIDLAEDESVIVELSEVEGVWVPKRLAASWGDTLKTFREDLDQLGRYASWPDDPAIVAVLEAIETTLVELDEAPPEQVEAALQLGTMRVVAAAMALQGRLG